MIRKNGFFIPRKQNSYVDVIDAFIILGGNMARVPHYASLPSVNKPVILSGDHHILDQKGKISQAEDMKHLLSFLMDSPYSKLDSKNILCEDKSVDILTNFYFSKPIIEQVLSGSEFKTIGIITDAFNMKRSFKCGDWVFKNNINFIGFPRFNDGTVFNKIYEPLVTAVWSKDLNKYSSVDEYIEKAHPHFVENPKKSLYGTLIKAAKFIHKKNLI